MTTSQIEGPLTSFNALVAKLDSQELEAVDQEVQTRITLISHQLAEADSVGRSESWKSSATTARKYYHLKSKSIIARRKELGETPKRRSDAPPGWRLITFSHTDTRQYTMVKTQMSVVDALLTLMDNQEGVVFISTVEVDPELVGQLPPEIIEL